MWNGIKNRLLTMYKIYAQIGFGTNRQTFNKNIATAEKSPIFTSHKSYTKPLAKIKIDYYEKHTIDFFNDLFH